MRGWAERPDRLGGIIGIAHDTKLLAIRVQLVNQVGRHLDLAAAAKSAPAALTGAA
jgi:hypothetical protein